MEKNLLKILSSITIFFPFLLLSEPSRSNEINFIKYPIIQSDNSKCRLMNILLDNSDRKNITTKIRKKAKEKFGCYIFGDFLDGLSERLEKRIQEKDLNSFKIEIPKNFLIEEMDLNMKVDKNKLKLTIYQEYDSEKIKLLDTSVALGMNHFPTPIGDFFLRRIINYPIWYPPKWANTNIVPKPGKNNPYGLWMSELSRISGPGNYDWGVSGDTNIRLHSTNKPDSIGKYSSHGCIRIHPHIAEELFPFLLHYIPHEEERKTSRGIIYPLKKPIKISIE
ncbi:MAG: L,D-transpeptidase [archaeon]